MTSALDVAVIIHTVFAALWTGGTLLMASTVIPAARNELLSKEALALIAQRFSYLTAASSLLLLVSGGYLAATLYTVETLQSTGQGHLVLTMVGLWLVLGAILSVSFRHLTDIPAETSVVAAATKARPWLLGGSIVSIGLLVVAGLL